MAMAMARSRSLASCVAALALASIDGAHAFATYRPRPPAPPPGRVPTSARGPSRRAPRTAPLCSAAAADRPAERDVRAAVEVTVALPLGIVLEEADAADPSRGVVIIGINEGNAADVNRDAFAEMKKPGSADSDDGGGGRCVCIRDKILAVDGIACADRGFDDVVALLGGAEADAVTLSLGRLAGSTVLNYGEGVCVAALPGESYGFLAARCGVGIPYECRSGHCETCARRLEFPDRDAAAGGGNEVRVRLIRHCVGRVPRGYAWLHVPEP